MDCPRCKIEMHLIDFQRDTALPTGRVLRRYVYRCTKCLLDSSPNVIYPQTSVEVHTVIEAPVHREMFIQPEQIGFDFDLKPDFSYLLKSKIN